jgi:hypothetical protein
MNRSGIAPHYFTNAVLRNSLVVMLIYFIYKSIVNKGNQRYRRHATSLAIFLKILYTIAPHNKHHTPEARCSVASLMQSRERQVSEMRS